MRRSLRTRSGSRALTLRAREQTQVYVAREDLGEQGMDAGAIERLGERMRRSGGQEASIAREVD